MIKYIKKLIKNQLLKLTNKFLLKEIYYNRTEFINFFMIIRPLETSKKMIRIGSGQDGGYLVPDDLEGIKYCFSPGVGDNSSFEEDLYSKYKIHSYLCDNSVEYPNSKSNGIKFLKKHLGLSDTDSTISFRKWLSNNKIDNEMILQMDVEGFEYDFLFDTTAEDLNKFRIIIIEFHSFEDIFTYHGFKLINSSFLKILKTHSVVHIHPNNIISPFSYKGIEIPTGIEVTFYNNSRILKKSFNKSFPHFLDKPCIKENEDFPLPRIFYDTNLILNIPD